MSSVVPHSRNTGEQDLLLDMCKTCCSACLTTSSCWENRHNLTATAIQAQLSTLVALHCRLDGLRIMMEFPKPKDDEEQAAENITERKQVCFHSPVTTSMACC